MGNDVHFDLAKGGTLNIDNGMNFLGQVDIGREATVNVNSETYFYRTNPPPPWAQSRKSGTPKPTYSTFSMQRGRRWPRSALPKARRNSMQHRTHRAAWR